MLRRPFSAPCKAHGPNPAAGTILAAVRIRCHDQIHNGIATYWGDETRVYRHGKKQEDIAMKSQAVTRGLLAELVGVAVMTIAENME